MAKPREFRMVLGQHFSNLTECINLHRCDIGLQKERLLIRSFGHFMAGIDSAYLLYAFTLG